MVDYLVLIILVMLVSAGLNALGLHAAWGTVPLVLLALPSLYANITGAPFLATDRRNLQRMIDLAEIEEGELVIDFGSGDGRLLRAARLQGAEAIGYELSVFLYAYSKLRGDNVRWQSFWQADIYQADVVFCYLLPNSMERVYREIWPELKLGCRLVVSTFPLRELEPTHTDGLIFRYDKIIRPVVRG